MERSGPTRSELGIAQTAQGSPGARGWTTLTVPDTLAGGGEGLPLPFGRPERSTTVSTLASPSLTLDPDAGLVRRMANGDEHALATLYDRYAGPLHLLALRIAGERADADEVVLDAFAQAWREAGRFRPDRGSVAAWLTTICRSRALDLVRSRNRRGQAIDRAQRAEPLGAPGLGAGGGDPAGITLHAERVELVHTALKALPPPQREAIELAYYHGLSQAEIAERLSQPLGTIKTRVRLAMERLRDALRTYHTEAPV